MTTPSTPRAPLGPSDQQVERVMGSLLRVGVFLSAAIIFVGGLWYVIGQGAQVASYRAFRGEPAGLEGLSGILRGLRQGQSTSLIQLGVLVLLATPVARVAMSLVAFLLQRNRKFIIVTAIVLLLLLVSIFGLRS